MLSLVINAQQLPVFTQYIFNKYIFNPAVTGTEDNFSATANYRYQWQGITDAPRTYIMSVHGPHKFKSFGLGFSFTPIGGSRPVRQVNGNRMKFLGADIFGRGFDVVIQPHHSWIKITTGASFLLASARYGLTVRPLEVV